jgi:23S rRNA (adenine2030-N6)-methyltransferase
VNYRHGFHAGNFADVFKHITLMRILTHLARKDGAFRATDVHAGAGLYNLHSDEARRGGEWRNGIALFQAHRFSAAAEPLLEPYRQALTALDRGGTHYPGSPLLIRHVLRQQDRAVFNELHPETAGQLARQIGRDRRISCLSVDAYIAWKAQIPPPERRGLVLVDPPFEKPGEFQRLADGLSLMARKWPTGMAALWYPIKESGPADALEQAARASGFEKLLVLELHVDDSGAEGPLAACGLLLANPPWTLHDEMNIILPELATALAHGTAARWRAEWLAGP